MRTMAVAFAVFAALSLTAQEPLYPVVFAKYTKIGFEAFTQKQLVTITATFGVAPPHAVRLWVNGRPTVRLAAAAPEEIESVPGVGPAQPIAAITIPRVFSHTGIYDLELELLWDASAPESYPRSAKGRIAITALAESYGACYEPTPLAGEGEGRVTQVYIVNALEVPLQKVSVWIGNIRVADAKLISGGTNAAGINTGLIETESMLASYYSSKFVAPSAAGQQTTIRIEAADGAVYDAAAFPYAYPPVDAVGKRRAVSHDAIPPGTSGPFLRCRNYPVF